MAKMCEFEGDGLCYALACFSSQGCGARDERGVPCYVPTDECRIVEEGE